MAVTLPGSEAIELTYVPPGTFTMGSPEDEEGRKGWEHQREVTLTQPFFIAVTEVTQSQWEALTGVSHSQLRDAFAASGARSTSISDPLHPQYAARYVSWAEAMSFCEQLTRQEREAGRLPRGWVYRLPTEAEWEYACRAGTKTRFFSGNDVSDLSRVGFHRGNRSGYEAEKVGLLDPNEWGIYDMHGSVAEWCADAFRDPYPPDQTDPYTAPHTPDRRAARGGSYFSEAGDCRSASRVRQAQDWKNRDTGFRIVLAPGIPDSVR